MLVLPLLAALCAPALGQEDDPSLGEEGISENELAGFGDDFEDIDLQDILGDGGVETALAGGYAESVDDAPGSVTVLTRAEIHNLGVATLADVLRTVPGVDVQRDGLGRVRISLRGVPTAGASSSSDNVLLLFNGVRLNEPLAGGATAANLDVPADDIERLEVLRGPGSVVFGEGALAGVIAVTTRVGDLDGIEASTGFGSFGSQRHYVRVGNVVGEDFRISGFVYISDTDGAELAVPRDRQSRIDDELSGHAGIQPVSLAPGFADTERREVETNYRIQFREYELNFRFHRELGGNYFGFNETLGEQGSLDNKQWLLDVAWRRQLGPGRLTARLGHTLTRRFEVQTAAPAEFRLPSDDPSQVAIGFPDGIIYQGDHSARRFGGEAHYDVGLGSEHRLVAGASLHREQAFAGTALANYDFNARRPLGQFDFLDGTFPKKSREVAGLWIQETWTRSPFRVTAGLRLDAQGEVGATFVPRLAAVWSLDADTSLKLLYGRSFRAPTLTELYFNPPGIVANDALDPMVADTLEVVGVRRLGQTRLAGSVFFTFVDDVIATDRPVSPFDPQSLSNAWEYDVRGLELEAYHPFGVESYLFGNYTLQSSQLADGGDDAPWIPRHRFNAGAAVAAGRYLMITPSVSMRSGVARWPGDPRPRVGAHALFNLSVRLHKLVEDLEVRASGQNLFDDDYAEPAPPGGVAADYPAHGRSFSLYATYTF
jgi:iron complex outermembrane receptor protein